MELKVKVERVFYPRENSEGDWYIIGTDKGTIKGKMSWRPEPNELLCLEGEYSAYQGKKEFKFKSARADIPVSSRDQLHYVCEKTSGFGFAMESKIWETWGESWKEDIEPGIIKTLNGAKFDRLQRAVDEFTTKQEEAETVAWLMSTGATVNMSQAAWAAWQKEAIGIVKNNCYRLADLQNYGFANVDGNIRHKFAIADDDPRRIKAAIMYCIKQLTDEGSTLVYWHALKDSVMGVIGGIGLALVNQCVRDMFDAEILVAFPESLELCSARDYSNAVQIWNFVS